MCRVSLGLTVLLATRLVAAPGADDVFQAAVESGERTWERVNTLHPELSSREIFSYALALCEADVQLDRLERLFEVGARMQDRDQESRGYGNLRWRWREGAVLDYNAVEFCMQDATLTWLRHADRIPAKAKATLHEILEYAVEGCLRHQVGASYTNIALMNAGDLILLGELLDRPQVTAEGVERLRRCCLYTWEAGIHEYDSPTYYGTDLDDLLLIAAFARSAEAKQMADTLLELFWTDLAANWFPPAHRLAGTCSRDYDYLHGLGYLEGHLAAAGWTGGEGVSPPARMAVLAGWRPPERLHELSRQRFPRLVRQSWGLSSLEAKTHYLLPDVTLGSSSAGYGSMDLPLTVTLAGDRTDLRCYFIPDGRHDPYGKIVIPAGPHLKTLHLQPFFTAAQRTVDAVGLVAYPTGTRPEGTATLESHFVFPRDVDEVWLGDRKLELDQAQPSAVELEPGQAVTFRQGTAAVGIRVPWSRGLSGGPARAALVNDGNPYGALRLTVAHHDFWGLEAPDVVPGAAFWVRVGSGVEAVEFVEWREAFEAAPAEVDASPDRVRIEVAGVDGPVSVGVAQPYRGAFHLDPTPTKAVLELDGEDLGRPMLERLAFVKEHEQQLANLPEHTISADEGVYLEAESGRVAPAMDVAADPEASGGRYVWTPGEVGGKGQLKGALTWKLNVPRVGTWHVWARVLTPTPDDDSFMVRVATDQAEPLALTDWHCGSYQEWTWSPVLPDAAKLPSPIALPAGEVTLELRTREDGAKVDLLFLTPNVDERPK